MLAHSTAEAEGCEDLFNFSRESCAARQSACIMLGHESRRALHLFPHTHAYEIIMEKQTHADTACKIVTDALRGADIIV